MNDGGVYFDSTAAGPHAVTEEWLSFEARMRRRRVGRCLLRADLALDDGSLAVARTAIDEARQLDSECPELEELENRLRGLDGTMARSHGTAVPQSETATGSPAPDTTSPVLPSATASGLLQSRRWAVSSAFVAVLLTGTALGSFYWRNATPTESVKAGPREEVAPQAPALRIEQDTVNARVVTPDLASDEPFMPVLPAMPAPPIADAIPQSRTDAIVLAVNRDVPPPAALPETMRSKLGLDELPRMASPEPPARPAPSPAIPAALEPEESKPAATAAPKVESMAIDEASIVRSVLTRYERAYSSLDARAASAVWPGVDRTALERAFDGLASQRVSLQSCDVTVHGAAARALCSGTAMWVPKVGGGTRTAARRWDFELRKRDGDWEIERAVAR
jgi:SnoaL-like domain